jgi:hypothetical protein
MKYELEVSENQLLVIEKALDFYGRFLAGQWRIPDMLEFQEWEISGKPDGFWDKRNQAQDIMDQSMSIFFDKPKNWSYGIGNAGLHEDAKVAYDIGRPILELFNKDSGSMNVYSSPGLSYSKEGRVLPKEVEE